MLDCGPIKDRIKKAEHESALFGLCDVVALVAEVESLRAENERMRRVVEAAVDGDCGASPVSAGKVYNAGGYVLRQRDDGQWYADGYGEPEGEGTQDLCNRLAAVEAERDKLKADEKQGIADYLALVDKDDAKYVEIQKLKAERDAEAKACEPMVAACRSIVESLKSSLAYSKNLDVHVVGARDAQRMIAVVDAYDARRSARGKDCRECRENGLILCVAQCRCACHGKDGEK